MTLRQPSEVLALCAGVLANIVASGAVYAESLRGAGSSSLLRWLDGAGLVRARSSMAEPELVNSSIFTITDESAIIYALILSGILGITAMVLSLRREARREGTILSSAAFVCGGISFAFISYWYAVLALGCGAACLALIRKRSHA
jgi:hypothetical protein